MSQETTQPLLIYSDYVCPFCYLGYASLEEFHESRESALETDWHPFDLRSQQRRPDGTIDKSVDSGKDEAYYEQAKQNVERLAEEYGVEMARPLMKDVDSYNAQRVAYQVRSEEPDRFDEFHRAVFETLWVDGEDISDRAVLERIATDVGVPEGFVAHTLADESTAATLESAFTNAREERITGVPTFVYGEHAARGAVPPAQLHRLVDGA